MLLEYAGSLSVDLSYQNFDGELVEVERMYSPPGGCLLLGEHDGEAVGCVAFRRLEQDVCEMKRLYVRPAFRGTGLGATLANLVIECANAAGYRCMRLDTLASMIAARRLYESLGFVEIEPYYDTPIAKTVFFELRLKGGAGDDSSE